MSGLLQNIFYQHSVFSKWLISIAIVAVLVIALKNIAFAQKISVSEDISIVDSKNQAELRWQGTVDWNVSGIEYRIFGKSDWKKVIVNDNKSSVIVGDLAEDMAYEWRLVFEDGIDQNYGPSYIFRTYAILLNVGSKGRLKMIKAAPRSKSTIHKLYSDRLRFSYLDDYHLSEYLYGEIFDPKGVVVSTVAISINKEDEYILDLTSFKVDWKLDDVYHLNLHDGYNQKRSVFFQISEPIEEPIEVGIIVNPIYVDCVEQASSLIEYYGEFSGGHAPYLVTWSVASAANFTTPLVEPKETEVMNSSSIPMLRLDYPLAYLVVITIEDGCGNFGEYALLVRCQENEDGESSLLFERVEYDRKNNRYWPE
ncbi:fibronectin type III domain-containing protein [Reichenbachiella sp. MALMAid0571]|uniref:fibronectin type III domain-containing protein n=1 Tax=Reichenbachiella sp. MALMAid0571 TaxID=3143939 RepID=UPI0032DF543D